MLMQKAGSLKKESEAPTRKGAAYMRMSTDHQRYSIDNQLDGIMRYAEENNITIVKTYTDEGKSGVSINGRQGFQQILFDIANKNNQFDTLLVYDVTRWGRFQDADESASYEYACRKAGINVIYCNEDFPNNNSLQTSLLKSLKRTMAAEYSHELSQKVFKGQCRLIGMGYRQGGPAGFGLRRALVDPSGDIKKILAFGEHKSIQTDRVILIKGPENEVNIVNGIYQAFVHKRMTEAEIARDLNQRGILTDLGRLWTRGTVHEVLTNEKYIGTNVFNRTSFKLKQKFVKNSPDQWIKKECAFDAIVPLSMFYMVQGILAERGYRYTDQELLDKLSTLYQKTGFLSGLIINESEDMPSSAVYAQRFGGLVRAYQLIGFSPERDYRYIEQNKLLRQLHPAIMLETQEKICQIGGDAVHDTATDLLWINQELKISIAIARCYGLTQGSARWKIRFDAAFHPDITVAVRLDYDNIHIKDYYLLPSSEFLHHNLKIKENNPITLDAYRFDTLDYLIGIAERSPFRRTA